MVPRVKVGIVGTGFIARGLLLALDSQPDLIVAKVLTRRNPDDCKEFPAPERLTTSIQQFLSCSELIVECSGDVLHATEVIAQAFEAALPVITMNAEVQVTTGSYLASRGFLTEAEGDQPGCLAALKENVEAMGFHPLVYGNIKGFLNLNPTLEEMQYWSKRNGISLQMVTAFTDGTKVQIEQALVANGLGAGIAKAGLLGLEAEDVHAGGAAIAAEASKLGRPLSDYLLAPKAPPGIFITAGHDSRQQEALSYFKLGKGPHYTLLQNYHLCHLEILKTIRRVLNGGGILLNNSTSPSISVAAIAKRVIPAGTHVEKAIGSFDFRGIAIERAADPDHVPIGLLCQAVITRAIEPGQAVRYNDVELPDSLALRACLDIRKAGAP
ncbi:NAD(P)-dependent oxidoreductase [Paenibacillus koleovorans]|uniref:NAD(P)-dependent oxidoreductase n=1 Tax=Paenibacillus koleovorans TaxID=121608 RepID=UPI000FDC5FB3|nr:NAD(P)-dependent oxidoreductase [Paenibacillus koleovorans]